MGPMRPNSSLSGGRPFDPAGSTCRSTGVREFALAVSAPLFSFFVLLVMASMEKVSRELTSLVQSNSH